jgi:hypothetical protein
MQLCKGVAQVDFSAELKRLAGAARFSPEMAREFEGQLWEAMRASSPRH